MFTTDIQAQKFLVQTILPEISFIYLRGFYIFVLYTHDLWVISLGMLGELCARMFSKSTNTFQVVRWFSALPAESFEDDPAAMNIIEGPVYYRRKKKWKSRWAVLRRVNPAADVINLVIYQDQVSARSRQKEKAFISLETFAGLQLLNKLDKHYNVIIAITANEVVRLSFETIDERSEWVNCIQRHFGQEQSFDGIIPNKQKIKSGEATLRFYKNFFSLTRKDNYRLIGKWKLVDLPHYGAVYGAFAFEVKEGGGTCIYYFATKHGRELHQLFDNVCRGGEVTSENNYVEPLTLDRSTPQRSVSQQDGPVSQPNFFKRTWQRISQRRKTNQRPRSQSEPGETKRKRRGNNRSAYNNRRLPNVPGSGSNRSGSTEPEARSSDMEAVTHPVTPDGYEIMTGGEEDDVVEASKTRKRRENRISEATVEVKTPSKATTSIEAEDKRVLAEESDHDGYVVVDGVDVEEIIKEAEKRLEEKNKADEEKEKKLENAKKIMSTSENNQENVETSYEKMEIRPHKPSTHDDKGGKAIASARDELTEEKKEKEAIVNSGRNSDGYDNVDVPVAIDNELKRNGNDNIVKSEPNKPPKTPVRPKSLESKQELLINSTKTRRGIKNPPPELILPQDSPSSERPYVNSPPKTADYVNVPGRRGTAMNNAVRSRSKTTNNKPGSKKLNLYDIYDGNDDSIYHSVESLMPGNPAYQNLRAESNRSHSFDNIPGHAYTNLPGKSPDSQVYQNVAPPGTQAYVNVNAPKRRFQRNQNSHHLNYIQVEGIDGMSGQYGPPSFSVPTDQHNAATKNSGSEYTWIDESRTRLLKETARMHSDLRKENLPKVTKKY